MLRLLSAESHSVRFEFQNTTSKRESTVLIACVVVVVVVVVIVVVVVVVVVFLFPMEVLSNRRSDSVSVATGKHCTNYKAEYEAIMTALRVIEESPEDCPQTALENHQLPGLSKCYPACRKPYK